MFSFNTQKLRYFNLHGITFSDLINFVSKDISLRGFLFMYNTVDHKFIGWTSSIWFICTSLKTPYMWSVSLFHDDQRLNIKCVVL